MSILQPFIRGLNIPYSVNFKFKSSISPEYLFKNCHILSIFPINIPCPVHFYPRISPIPETSNRTSTIRENTIVCTNNFFVRDEFNVLNETMRGQLAYNIIRYINIPTKPITVFRESNYVTFQSTVKSQ